MSAEKKSTKEQIKATEKRVPEAMVKIRVIKNGTVIGGAKCAKTLVTSLPKSKAEALQELGMVQIIGIA